LRKAQGVAAAALPNAGVPDDVVQEATSPANGLNDVVVLASVPNDGAEDPSEPASADAPLRFQKPLEVDEEGVHIMARCRTRRVLNLYSLLFVIFFIQRKFAERI
jgi:hypothetical protein